MELTPDKISQLYRRTEEDEDISNLVDTVKALQLRLVAAVTRGDILRVAVDHEQALRETATSDALRAAADGIKSQFITNGDWETNKLLNKFALKISEFVSALTPNRTRLTAELRDVEVRKREAEGSLFASCSCGHCELRRIRIAFLTAQASALVKQIEGLEGKDATSV